MTTRGLGAWIVACRWTIKDKIHQILLENPAVFYVGWSKRLKIWDTWATFVSRKMEW